MKKILISFMLLSQALLLNGMDSQAVAQAQTRSCQICKKSPEAGQCEKLFKCTRCQKGLYCSRACQGIDWPSHKVGCKAAVKDEPKPFISTAPLTTGSATPLHRACQFGDFEEVKRIIENNEVNPESTDHQKCTPLHIACFAKLSLDTIKYLIEQCKVKVNSTDLQGNTPLDLLFMPPFKPEPAICDYLCAAGCKERDKSQS